MANVDGIIGGGLVLSLTNDAAALTVVQGLVTVNPPAPTANTADSTDQSSDGIEEFIVALISPGDMSGTIKYVPGNSDDELFREHFFSKEKRPATLSQPGAPGQPAQVSSVNVAVTAFTPNDGEVNGIRTSSFTLKISGLPTQAAAA